MFVSLWLLGPLVAGLVVSGIMWAVCRGGEVYWKDSSATWREYAKSDIATVSVQLKELAGRFGQIRDCLNDLKKHGKEWEADSNGFWTEFTHKLDTEITAARLEREIIRARDRELTELRALKEQFKALVATDVEE